MADMSDGERVTALARKVFEFVANAQDDTGVTDRMITAALLQAAAAVMESAGLSPTAMAEELRSAADSIEVHTGLRGKAG